ncbi:hypothetical protein [Neolewinella persica]|uniref:hypothetical protein n=1 Tax=Neolewinella persica TaxID=70998 RepID=UPI00037D110F|nr:hypothetical protein [Neolewinella persica]
MSKPTSKPAPAPTPPPERTRRRPKNQKKPMSAGNLKLCLRIVDSSYPRPMTIWSDKRHGGDFEKELAQLRAAKIRIDNSPKYTLVEWAAIYDCSNGMEHGPEILQFTLLRGEWHQHQGR